MRFSHRGACLNLVAPTVPVPRKQADYLASLGARVEICEPPTLAGHTKPGPDDYLVKKTVAEFPEHVRALVEPVCRNRGHWNSEYNNWIVFRQFRAAVVGELEAEADHV